MKVRNDRISNIHSTHGRTIFPVEKLWPDVPEPICDVKSVPSVFRKYGGHAMTDPEILPEVIYVANAIQQEVGQFKQVYGIYTTHEVDNNDERDGIITKYIRSDRVTSPHDAHEKGFRAGVMAEKMVQSRSTSTDGILRALEKAKEFAESISSDRFQERRTKLDAIDIQNEIDLQLTKYKKENV